MWRLAAILLLVPVVLSQDVGAGEPRAFGDADAAARDVDTQALRKIDPSAHSIHMARETARVADLGGEIVILHFWQSNCAPCLVELPDLAKFMDSGRYADLRDKGMRIVAVSHDIDVGTARRFLVRYAPGLLPARIEPEWALAKALYGRDGRHPPMPASFAIDLASGAVLVEKIGPMDWNGDEFRNFQNAAINIKSDLEATQGR